MAPKLSSTAAIELANRGTQYLDVRSVPEFEAGHPPGAYNIPLLHAGPAGLLGNANFEAEVEAVFRKDDPLLVGCKAGGRSARAIEALERIGYTSLYDVSGGFSGNDADPGWEAAGGETSTTAAPGRGYADLRG